MAEGYTPPEILQAALEHEQKITQDRSAAEGPKLETQELSPEVLKKVMDKVQDINRPGIGFSGLGKLGENKLKSLFKNGLLGDNWREEKEGAGPILGAYKNDADEKEAATVWASKTRTKKNTIVHFNITGRMAETQRYWDHRNDPGLRDRTDNWMGEGKLQSQIDMPQWTRRRDGVTVLFDSSPYKEYEADDQIPLRPKVFYADDTSGTLHYHEGQATPEFEYGFNLHYRVRPKDFTGIFLRVHKPARIFTDEEVKKKMKGWLDPKSTNYEQEIAKYKKKLNSDEERSLKDEVDPIKIQQRVNEVVEAMTATYKDKPEMMVPIYDRGGNLLWPKPMGYEEVQRLVAHRDKARERGSGSSHE